MKITSIVLIALTFSNFAHARAVMSQKERFNSQYFDGATVVCNKKDAKGKLTSLQLSGCKSRQKLIDESKVSCQGKGGVMSLSLVRQCTPTAP